MADLIATRLTRWKTILLLCGKCARKLDGGFGPKGKDTLRSALQIELSARGLRGQVRIIETRCMGVCPKKSVTVVNAARPSTIMTVPRKTSAVETLAVLVGGDDKRDEAILAARHRKVG